MKRLPPYEDREAWARIKRENAQLARTHGGLPPRFHSVPSIVDGAFRPELADVQMRLTDWVFDQQDGAELPAGAAAVLAGPSGSGKSHLAAGVVMDSWVEGFHAHFITTRDVLWRVKATWQRGSETTEREVLVDLSTWPTLVLDDLGHLADTDARIIRDLLSLVYEQRNKLLITTCLSAVDLGRVLGPQTTARLRQGLVWLPVPPPAAKNAAGGPLEGSTA